MKLEFIDGPQGPQRISDGGGHSLIAGTDAIPKGTICIADYANTLALGLTIPATPSTVPGTKWYPETIMIPLASSTAAFRGMLTAQIMVATEAGPADKGTSMRFSECGQVKVLVGTTVTAGFKEVGMLASSGAVRTAVSGDVVLGLTSGTAVTSGTPGVMYFDSTTKFVKA